MDTGVIIAVIGLVFTALAFFVGRTSASKSEGKASGVIETDVKYIKESVVRIESKFDSDVHRLEGRIDEASKYMLDAGSSATKALASAKAAHKRLDEHLERDHQVAVDKRNRED